MVAGESSEAFLMRLGELAHRGEVSAAIGALIEWGRVNRPRIAKSDRQREFSRFTRDRPLDARDLTLAELGLDAATVAHVERAFRRFDGLTAGELCKWSAADLADEFGIDEAAVRAVKVALRKAKLRLRGD